MTRSSPIERDRPDAALDDVGVDLDAAVLDEAAKAVPARERIADRLGELALPADAIEFFAKPHLKAVDDWPAVVAADGVALISAAAANVLLYHIERRDAFQRLARDRRRASRGELIETAAHMRPCDQQKASLTSLFSARAINL